MRGHRQLVSLYPKVHNLVQGSRLSHCEEIDMLQGRSYPQCQKDKRRHGSHGNVHSLHKHR
jgi:hypothetical protein